MILKICGITNQEDASGGGRGRRHRHRLQFLPAQPALPRAGARGRDSNRAPGVRRVGVFVNEARERVEEIARIAALDVAQLHGDETPADYPASLAVWKAVRVGAGFRPCAVPRLPGGSAAAGWSGGNLRRRGQTFDWRLAAGGSAGRIILAGGLDASNVAEAVALAHPWGVDACSRIESAPGKKDHRKMNEFLQAAKAALGA